MYYFYKKMSIQGTMNEMEDISREIARNSKRNSELRKIYKRLEVEVLKYFAEKDEVGVRYTNKNNKTIAVIVENKIKREGKKVKDAERDASLVLVEYGIESVDALKVLKKIAEAKKGEEVDSKKIKIKAVEEAKKKRGKKAEE